MLISQSLIKKIESSDLKLPLKIMQKHKITAVIIMCLLVLLPAFADRDKDKKQQKYEEIDNYDFLYNNENYSETYNYAPVDNVLDEAFSHIGARYRSGQAGPNAFDCSGFTSYVFKNMGVELYRSSREQYNQGSPVKKDDLQSGDLVFFTSRGSGRSIGHVGIVVDVDPMTGSFNFIHASIKGVKVSNSNEAYYSRRYVGARRVM